MSAGNVDAAPSRAPPIPQFLNKLLAMVDDPATDKFIKWADDGNSFYVFNPDQFAKELLGTYYKTDASASFVRQLNMYGFHKVPHVRQGALKSDKQAQAWHYQNPKFKRGRPDLLPFIARKGKPIGSSSAHSQHNNLALQPIKQADIENDIELLSGPINDDITMNNSSGGATSAEVAKGTAQNLDMSQIINGLATIKRHQTLISDNLKELQTSNQALWQEAMEARERHRKHQETINRILKFLASLFQGASNSPVRTGGGASRKDGPGAVIPRARLMIKDAPEEDKESSTNSPKSTRMEEVDVGDDEVRPYSATIKPTDVETPTTNPVVSGPQADSTPTGYSQSGVTTPNANGFYRDQGHYLANGTYIPPTDIYKILQWLQQNQIPIPGVYTPPAADPQALATIPAGGHFNPIDFLSSNQAQSSNNVSSNPQTNVWPTYGPPVVPNQTTPAMSNAVYQTGNQLFNNLLPLASVASEPAPAANMAEVSHNTDRLEQLSNNVEAMQQGIDSLIAGMGLDPTAAATLQNDGLNSNPLLAPSTTTDANQYSGGTGVTAAGSNGYTSQAPNPDLGSFQTVPPDFDLDTLLKQLGMAAAASTPPALHSQLGEDFAAAHDASTAFTNSLNPTFDSSFFNDMNMFNQNNDTSSYFGTQTGNTSNNNAQPPSGYLNEITSSPVLTRDDSAEPSLGDGPGDSGRGTLGARGRVKKRKNESVSDDGGNLGGVGPIRRQSRSSGRNAKRRK